MAAKTPAQKREQEKQTVGLMIELYCHGHHGTRGHTLCPDCEALRSYADARVDHCPHMETPHAGAERAREHHALLV